MQIFVPKESEPGERRVALVPDTIRKLVARGAVVTVESGLGASCNHSDAAYQEAEASISTDRKGSLSSADLVVRVRKPPFEEVALLKKGCIHVSFLDPFTQPELIDELVKCGISAISMEMIPRTTLAQKLDALSSQASLAGYYAVIVAAERLDKIFPMLMTPAGTIAPSRVFIIGAGVAGLQAIATAKRLGARVEAFDTRPVVEEEVRSLGAKFIKADLGEIGQTKDGYAKELTPEQQQKQREAMVKACAHADVVITTAKVFGKRAPLIITTDMIKQMKPGSVIVDLAVETGGNVEGSRAGQEVEVDGVRVLGLANLEGEVAVDASQMYSANMGNLIESYWVDKTTSFRLKLDDEIIQGCLVTHEGQIVNEMIKALRQN